MYKPNIKQLQIQQIGANIHALSEGINGKDINYANLNFPSQLELYNATGGGIATNFFNYNMITGIFANNVKYNFGYYTPAQYYFDAQSTSTQMSKNDNNIVYLKTSSFSEVISDLKDFLTQHATDSYGTIRFTLDENQTVKVGKFKNNTVEFEDSTIPINSFGIDDSLVIVDDYYFYVDHDNVSASNPRVINNALVEPYYKAATGFGPLDIDSIISFNSGNQYEYTDVINTYNSAPSGLFINPFPKITYSTRHMVTGRSLNNIYAYNISQGFESYPPVSLLSGVMDYAMAETYDVGCMFLQFNVIRDAGYDSAKTIPINIRCFDRQKLLRYISYFGMKATYSQKAALDLPSEDFPSFDVNPDDPVNPGGKAEGYPDNQKIELNIPKSSPSGGNGSIYILNPTHLNYIRNGLWDEVVFQSFWGQGINPFDYIVGLWWYPFSTYDLYGSQISYKRVKLGSSYIVNNDVPGVDDGATINLLDGGKLHVPIMTDSYLDYEPYTSYNLFIPYIGFQSLNSQDIVGKELSLKYFVNIYDGTLTAFLFADKNLINTYEGVVGVKIPMTNYDSRIQTLQFYTQGQQMLSRASQVISGGVGAASNFGVFGQEGNLLNSGTNIATNTLSNIFDANSNKANQALNAVNNNYGMPYGLPGIYAPQTAYLKIETSLAQIPTLKIGQEGKNASISGTISGLGLSGFVKTTSSTIITAAGEEYITEEEKMEIDRIMKGGVVING